MFAGGIAMPKRKKTSSPDLSDAKWEMIGGGGPIPVAAAHAVADLLLSAVEDEENAGGKTQVSEKDPSKANQM